MNPENTLEKNVKPDKVRSNATNESDDEKLKLEDMIFRTDIDEPAKKKQKYVVCSTTQVSMLVQSPEKIPELETVNTEEVNASTSSSNGANEVSKIQSSKQSITNIFTVNSMVGTIKVKSDEFLFSGSKEIKRFKLNFSDVNNLMNPPIVFNPIAASNASHVGNISNLFDVEYFIEKYFTKSVKDGIVIMANILNLIVVNQNHCKQLTDEERDINTDRNQKDTLQLLHDVLIREFLNAMYKVNKTEYEPALKMLFLCILTVFKRFDDLHKTKIVRRSTFTQVLSILKNTFEKNHGDIVKSFCSHFFRQDCIKIMGMIDEYRDSDIITRFSLFYSSLADIRKYKKFFKPVEDALLDITQCLNSVMSRAIVKAVDEYRLNSKFKDAIEMHSNVRYRLARPDYRQLIFPVNRTPIIPGRKNLVDAFTSVHGFPRAGTSTSSDAPHNVLPSLPPVLTEMKCYGRYCEKKPRLLCSVCKSAFYCSKNCQEVHWNASHKKECEHFASVKDTNQLKK